MSVLAFSLMALLFLSSLAGSSARKFMRLTRTLSDNGDWVSTGRRQLQQATAPTYPPPSPPPRPICDIDLAMKTVEGGLTQATCGTFPAFVKDLYDLDLDVYCGGVSTNEVIARSTMFKDDERTMEKGMNFAQDFEAWRAEIDFTFAKYGLGCDATLTLSDTCGRFEPVTATMRGCAPEPDTTEPVPPTSTVDDMCNVTITATKVAGGLNMPLCSSFAGAIKILYKTGLWFHCASVSPSGDAMVAESTMNYRSIQFIDTFVRDATKNANAGQDSQKLYRSLGLECSDTITMKTTCMDGGMVPACKDTWRRHMLRSQV